MQEVQNLFKPEGPALEANADVDANAEPSKIQEEPLKLNLFRTALNSASTNIGDVEH